MVDIKKENQIVKDVRYNDQDNKYDPPYVSRSFTDNFFQRTLSLLHGVNNGIIYKLLCTSAGILKVANTGSGFENLSIDNGTATDTYPASANLERDSKFNRFDIIVRTNNLTIQWRNAVDSAWLGAIDLAPGYYSFDFTSKSIQVKNTTSGNDADYQIIGFY